MGDLIKFLEFDWRSGLLFIAGLMIVSVFMIQKWDWIIERFGLTSKRQLAEDKQNADIKELKDHAKKTDENIDKICDGMEELKVSVAAVSMQVKAMQDKQDETERNRLRDRLGQSYRYYEAKGQWSSLEKEAFDGLVHSYEQSGGTNGLVHSVIIPASLKWKIVDE